MAFRFYNNVLDHHGVISPMVEVNGDKLVESNLDVTLPSSCDYSLSDLMSAGMKVAPVDPTVIHDSSATSFVADSVISGYVEPSKNSKSVEPSKND